MFIKKISIIIPCYNEIWTIEKVLARVLSVDFGREREIIIVDDCSTDGSRGFLEEFSKKGYEDIRILFHEKNQGKGAAIRTALSYATGEYVIVQDADLEYDPHDILRLIEHAEKTGALAVYGSRNITHNTRYLYPLFYWGVRVLTRILNSVYRQKLTDPETCYKFVHTDLLRFINLSETGFGIEIEITTKLSHLNIRILEVPISYAPRSFQEGKKITFRDGIQAAILVLQAAFYDLHYGLIDRIIRYARIRMLIRQISSFDGTILDIGCGRQGALAWLLRDRVTQYIGFDREVPSCTIKNLRFISGRVEQLSKVLPQHTIDCVIALAVIEHFDDPERFLRDCFALMKSSGILVLTTPPPRAKLILDILATFRIIDKREIDDHKTYFTSQRLKALLEHTGFTNRYDSSFLWGYNHLYVARKE